MPERDILDDTILALERIRLRGTETVYLPPQTAGALFSHGIPCSGEGDPSSAHRKPRVRQHSREPKESENPFSLRVDAAASDAGTRHSPRESQSDGVATADWAQLEAMVAGCSLCALHRTRTQAVFGEVDHHADLMFVGEGPGFHEDQSGRPFVGPAGKLLDKMIAAMQYSRETVYIANIVKCRPPGNRNPSDDEAACCLPYLNRQIDLVKPKALVLLGAVPLLHLLGKTGITKIHGQWFEYRGIDTMPTFHPSFLLRSPARKKEAWEDLQKVMVKLGKDPGVTLRNMRRG